MSKLCVREGSRRSHVGSRSPGNQLPVIKSASSLREARIQGGLLSHAPTPPLPFLQGWGPKNAALHMKPPSESSLGKQRKHPTSGCMPSLSSHGERRLSAEALITNLEWSVCCFSLVGLLAHALSSSVSWILTVD